ncbi:MAG TPA: PH domain-containing protein [Candidatus Paceibacterota bacterium]|nr:PH domain-containing protein [Candidatus Paceibacterota bacterium]
METNTISSFGTWNRLGSRTYWLFLFGKLGVSAAFFVLAVIFTIARSLSAMPAQVVPFLGLIGVACFTIFFVALGYALFASWIVYRSHEFCLADDALKVKQGVVTKQEVAIPYRQIQNVDIERSVSEQIFGLSRLVILTAGHEDAGEKDPAEGILPAMDKNLASSLQEELLKRADVQKVVQADAAANARI